MKPFSESSLLLQEQPFSPTCRRNECHTTTRNLRIMSNATHLSSIRRKGHECNFTALERRANDHEPPLSTKNGGGRAQVLLLRRDGSGGLTPASTICKGGATQDQSK